jgi:hypothetical protein
MEESMNTLYIRRGVDRSSRDRKYTRRYFPEIEVQYHRSELSPLGVMQSASVLVLRMSLEISLLLQ